MTETAVIPLAAHVDYAAGSIVSRTLVDKKAGTLTLFSFDAGQGLSEHTAPFDAVVQVLEGEAQVVVGGRELTVPAGHLTILPANVPHAVRALQRFKMLLTLIRS
ncbi:MAG: cupin domain-containing protein [Deltaproteobacteria bacterium]|nr:cupin domain-containing protein [Deltaproteobacteria bacterium]